MVCSIVVCCVFITRSVQMQESVDSPSVKKIEGLYV